MTPLITRILILRIGELCRLVSSHLNQHIDLQFYLNMTRRILPSVATIFISNEISIAIFSHNYTSQHISYKVKVHMQVGWCAYSIYTIVYMNIQNVSTLPLSTSSLSLSCLFLLGLVKILPRPFWNIPNTRLVYIQAYPSHTLSPSHRWLSFPNTIVSLFHANLVLTQNLNTTQNNNVIITS